MEDAELDALVVAAAGGDEGAWQRLWNAIEGPLTRVVAQRSFLGPLSRRDDDRANIVVSVMGRLRDDGFRRLQVYLDTKRENPRLRFMSWLRVVTKRVGIDYLRQHQNWIRRTSANASTPGRWVDAGTLPPDSELRGERPPVTNIGTVRELLEFAKHELPPEQLRALQLWAASETFDQIAHTMELPSAREAERRVRAALERMRRKFRIDEEPKP
jgi:DNA-directed RNA polymerase specialized sigma24 family protein